MMTTEMMTETRRELPRGWRWVRIGDVCVSRTGVRDPGSTPDEFFSYVDIGSVDNKTKRIIEAKRLLGNEAPSRARQVIRTSDVIVATTRPNLNAVALVPPELDNEICSTGFCVLRSQDKLEPQFLFAYVQSEEFVNALSDLVKGALYPAVTDSQVRDQLIPLPPLAEQQRIAALLNDQMAAVERARAAAEARLEAARALPAAYLREVFESEEARGWKVIPLGNTSDIGSGITLGRSFEETPTRSVPYLRVANVKDGYLDLSDVYEIAVPERDIEKCRLQWGDLLLTEGGDPDKLGRGSFWQMQLPECIHQNHIFRVRFDLTRHDPEFLSAQIGSSYGKAYFLAHAKQTTGIATINKRVLSGFPLMVPPLDVQKRIAGDLNDKLRSAEAAMSVLHSQHEAIAALPAALLRQAFSGEL